MGWVVSLNIWVLNDTKQCTGMAREQKKKKVFGCYVYMSNTK